MQTNGRPKWATQWERELREAREKVRDVQSKWPLYELLAEACEANDLGAYRPSFSVYSKTLLFIHLHDVPDFTLVEPLRHWLTDHGYPPTAAAKTRDRSRSYYHGGLTLVAVPPRGKGTEDDPTKCRYVKVGTKRVVPEPYEEDVFKVVCDEEMVAAEPSP